MHDDELQRRSAIRHNLIETGTDPYPASCAVTHTNAELQTQFSTLEAGQETDLGAVVAGRVMSIRNSGMFIDLIDPTGAIQIFTDVKGAETLRVSISHVDLGDWVQATGRVRRTKRGELTVNATQVALICKALRAPPEKFHGLQDTETRYRKRYLDMMANSETRERFRMRAGIITAIRQCMISLGYLEVETPILQSRYGGASARPFVTRHNALSLDLYLRIAPELYLKRLLVGGLHTRIFELNRNFRNEGLSPRHNPEFTMLEAYEMYADYSTMMGRLEAMIQAAGEVVGTSGVVEYQGRAINLKAPFKRVTMLSAVHEATGLDFEMAADANEAQVMAKAIGVEIEQGETWGGIVARVFEEKVEPTLIQPTHVTEFPKDISPFAKNLPGNLRLVERFETYVNGWEIANAFSELNDPIEQRARLEDQLRQGLRRVEGTEDIDADFLEAIEHGMPPTGGLGLGVDRLVMLLTNAATIKDVIAFPTMRNQ